MKRKDKSNIFEPFSGYSYITVSLNKTRDAVKTAAIIETSPSVN